MDPLEALLRVAYLQDRGLLPSQKTAAFLRATDRVERLKRWVDPQDTAADLDRKMLAVLARADTPDAAGVFLKVFAALAADGADLNAIKALLGHASLAATQVYMHNSIERLKAVYDKAHPKGDEE